MGGGGGSKAEDQVGFRQALGTTGTERGPGFGMCWGNIQAQQVFLYHFPMSLQRFLSPLPGFSAAPPAPRSPPAPPSYSQAAAECARSSKLPNRKPFRCPTTTDGVRKRVTFNYSLPTFV